MGGSYFNLKGSGYAPTCECCGGVPRSLSPNTSTTTPLRSDASFFGVPNGEKSKVVKLAILDADMDFDKDYGVAFRDIVPAALNRAGKSFDPPVEIRGQVFQVQRYEFPNPADFDGIFISGSRNSANDDEPWIQALASHIRKWYKAGVKITGVCFGHQITCRSLGGVVEKHPGGWELGVAPLRLTEEGKTFLGDNSPQELNIHYIHQDHVTKLPPNFHTLGGNEHSPIAGTVSGDHVLTLQGHPEVLSEHMANFIDQLQKDGVVNHEVAAQSRRTLGRVKHSDSQLLLKRMVSFFAQPRSASCPQLVVPGPAAPGVFGGGVASTGQLPLGL
eukprot:TRINITY_DN15166_c0_g1_i1.p1 TRINITY_DN15166_c0_g1~~TRINITY_DN15166_c0_g1_i1.p1  ORF type:complete len:331 (+),score=55.91 TRINITY_DN15166_c0_g1_i1:284-1276(+)